MHLSDKVCENLFINRLILQLIYCIIPFSVFYLYALDFINYSCHHLLSQFFSFIYIFYQLNKKLKNHLTNVIIVLFAAISCFSLILKLLSWFNYVYRLYFIVCLLSSLSSSTASLLKKGKNKIVMLTSIEFISTNQLQMVGSLVSLTR